MKFTSFIVTILSATAVTADEHNTKSMLRGVDTKVHAGVPVSSPTVHAGIPVPDPAVCRDDDDCPDDTPQCNNGEDGKPDDDCSEWKRQGRTKCCVYVPPDEEDTLSKKAEAMEKVAKVLPLLKDAAKVKSDAIVKEDCETCDNPGCPAGTVCEDWGDCSIGCMSAPDPVQDYCSTVCEGISCPGQKVCCPDRASGCTSGDGYTCTRQSNCPGLTLPKKAEAKEKVAKVLPLIKDAAKVKSDAMVKEDDNSTPVCACDILCKDGYTCIVNAYCESECIESAPIDPVPEPTTATAATAAAACGGEDPCDNRGCPANKPVCTTNWETCRASCSKN